MSSKTDQLIAKALSTTSEDEAIACLRMARKHNTGGGTTTQSTTSNNDWEAAARKYNKRAYELQEELKVVKIQRQIYADSSARHSLDAKFAKRQADIAIKDLKNRIVRGVVILVFAACTSFAIGYIF